MTHNHSDILRALKLVSASSREWFRADDLDANAGLRRAQLLKEEGLVDVCDLRGGWVRCVDADPKRNPVYVRLTLKGHQSLERAEP